MGKGRMVNVIVKRFPGTDDELRVWADKGLDETIGGVEGVRQVYSDGVKYTVTTDLRYDIGIVMDEIKAAIEAASKA